MPNPTCPANCDSDLPVVSFSDCNPQVNSSEIRRIFFKKTTGAPFTNWLNAAEWEARLSQTDTANDDTIRSLDVIGDLPAGAQVVKDISKRRRITISKDRTLNFTIDDLSPQTYEAARILECNNQYDWWFETEGGYMLGGNTGFRANIDINYVLARGADATEELQGVLTWRYKFMPERGLSPIFDSGNVTPTTFDTEFTFVSDVDADGEGVAATAPATSATTKFEFNAIDSPIGTPSNMNINIDGDLFMIVTFPSDYTGTAFKLTDADGIVRTGVFTNGNVNFS